MPGSTPDAPPDHQIDPHENMNNTMKRLRDEADSHMSGIIHGRLGSSLEELQRLFPECEVTSIPQQYEHQGATYHCGYRFRVSLKDGSPDAGSFTVPINKNAFYDIPKP